MMRIRQNQEYLQQSTAYSKCHKWFTVSDGCATCYSHHTKRAVRIKTVKVKVTLRYAMKHTRGVKIELNCFFNLGILMGQLVNATSRPLYPGEGPDAQ